MMVSGAYILILFNPRKQCLKIGKLGKIFFAAGYYFYVGSGMKSLRKRVLRHQQKKKTVRWHIDYLTRRFKFIEVKLFYSKERLECKIAKILQRKFTAITGFGCSDCRCPSHLFYYPKKLSLSKFFFETFKPIG